ncbi:unnamed protein product [Meganyctiphanes norvegica]|uniref:Uncharacterized protein n=1 Tax=Meganyctiphanes norvegica TaxID=48144 RepID=A0AAV2QFI2_MEGNR
MYISHIIINKQSVEKNTQTNGIPTDHAATEKHSTPVNHIQTPVSKLSKTLSLDSSIPVMPSMNMSTVVPFVPVHEMVTSSSKSYMPSAPHITEEKSNSRSNSDDSCDLSFPDDLGHIGKEDKLPIHGGLKNPIWVPPYICTHQGNNGEMCYVCKDTDTSLKRPEHRPDFTVLNIYGPRTPAKKCKCGTITSLTTCFSVFFLVFIVAFVVYDNVSSVHNRM